MKKILFSILALVAIATTARAQTKYDIWVGGVQVTSANASNITGGDIKSGTVTFKQSTNGVYTLTLTNVKIERSGKSKQGIRTGLAGLIINFEGTNTITTDNSCALRCDAETWLLTSQNSKTTLTEKIQEAIYVTGGKTLHFRGTGSGEIFVNSTSEYAIEGEKGTERVRFFSAPIVTLYGYKGSLVKLGKVVFEEETYPGTSVTLKATNHPSYPQVQNVAAWNEYGYNHIAAPIGGTTTHPAYNSSSKTILKPNGLSGSLTSYDIVINDDVVQLNSTHFPDAQFLAEVKQLYTKNNNGFPKRGFYSKAMAKAVKQMDVSLKKISNLKGVEHFTELTHLNCDSNSLTSLDVTKNTALRRLYCYNNQIKGDKMQALVNSLPTVTDGIFVVINTKNKNEKNVITKSQVTIAKGKGWKVYDYNDGDYKEYTGSDGTTAIDAPLNDNGEMTNDSWYSIDGVKLNGEPTKKGVYIIKGKKVKR